MSTHNIPLSMFKKKKKKKKIRNYPKYLMSAAMAVCHRDSSASPKQPW